MKSITNIWLIIITAVLTTASSHALHPVVGEKAPEISMENPDGQVIKLSDLRGKLVLIDFWASWCRSCRLDNQVLKAMYNRYHDKAMKHGDGFEIYSVSLDTDPALWKQAIANDKLNWTNHVSDFKKWDSPIVSDYNFKFIPHNLIIDAEGTVLAKNLYKDKLRDFLLNESE